MNVLMTIHDRYGVGSTARLVIRLGLAMAMYTLCRLAFYLYNQDLLGIDSWGTWWEIMLGGLRFDLSAVLYTNLLVIALYLVPHPWRTSAGYLRATTWVYLLCNIPMLVVNMADVVYYRYTGRRTSLDVLEEFAHEDTLGFVRLLWSFLPITLITIGLIVLWIWLDRRLTIGARRPKHFGWRYYVGSLVCLLAFIPILIGGLRGGFLKATRPIAPNHASAYTARPEQRAMVLNTPFVMIRTAGKYRLSPLSYMSNDEATQILDLRHLGATPTPYTGRMQGRNVVVIIWESLAREWVGALNRDLEGYEGYTPFLDSLLSESYYWTEAFASGAKSIDAMPALLGSVPRPIIPFVSSIYSGNKVHAIGEAAQRAGYETIYFHNAPNGSMGFDAMARQLGFRQYRGKSEYGDDRDFDGSWGIWDEPFLQYMVRELSTLPQPFVAVEFTTTSHEPYRVPEQYEGVLPEGDIPMHRCIRYTDMALRHFFEAARQTDWYRNTLFVITADHAVSGYRPEYKTSVGLHSIPMILFDPQGGLVGVNTETIVQQTDLMPTLVDLLGWQYPHIAFGRNMLDPSGEHFAVHPVDNAYQMIRGRYVLQHDGERPLALYDRIADRHLRDNLLQSRPDVLAEILPVMQSYLQQFTQRMTNDALRIDAE